MFIVNPYIYGSYLVETYSIPIAYSLRKLSSTSTSAIRVRRDSDNAEQDIGFSGNDFDTSSLSTFVGANSAYVTKWYNQGTGGSTYDASQSQAIYQPRIVNAGTISVTANGKASVEYLGGQFEKLNMAASGDYTGEFTAIWAHERKVSTHTPMFGRTGNNAGGLVYWYTDGRRFNVDGGDFGTDNTSTGEFISEHFRDSSDDTYFYVNNVGLGGNPYNTTTGGTFGVLGNSNSRPMNGLYIESIFLNSYDSAVREAIRDDINTYYSIY